jgi:hypothetical protein
MEHFRIVLSGELLQGVDAATARKQLAKLLGKDEAFAAQFIAGHSRTVKRGVDAATAVRYVTALRAIGVECRFEPDTLDFDNTEAPAVAPVAASNAAPGAPMAAVPEPATLSAAIPVRKGSTLQVKEPVSIQRQQMSGWLICFSLLIVLILGWLLAPPSNTNSPENRAVAVPVNNDQSTVVSCDWKNISSLKIVDFYNWQETAELCDQMVRRLGHQPTVASLRNLAKTVYALHHSGSKATPKEDAYQLLRIIESRGQQEDVAAMWRTFDMVFKIFNGMEGRVTPKDINIMLSTMGESAKKLSDDGIINLAAMLSVQRQDAGG